MEHLDFYITSLEIGHRGRGEVKINNSKTSKNRPSLYFYDLDMFISLDLSNMSLLDLSFICLMLYCKIMLLKVTN